MLKDLENMESLQEARIKEDKDHRDEFFIKEFDIIEAHCSREDFTEEELNGLYSTYLILLKHIPHNRGEDVVTRMTEVSDLLEECEDKFHFIRLQNKYGDKYMKTSQSFVETVASKLIGADAAAAHETLEFLDIDFRHESIDGESYILTADHCFDRINLTIVDGKITKARIG